MTRASKNFDVIGGSPAPSPGPAPLPGPGPSPVPSPPSTPPPPPGAALPRLSIYPPGSIPAVKDIMDRYMVYPSDMLVGNLGSSGQFPSVTITGLAASLSGIEFVSTTQKQNYPRMSVVGYDIEHWIDTPQAEQDDPVGSADSAAQIVHSHGLKFMFNPDAGFMLDSDSSRGDQPFWQSYHYNKFDQVLIQTQGPRWAGGSGTPGDDIQAYYNNVSTVISHIKNVNPSCIVWVQLSMRFDTAQVVIDKTNAVRSLIDGIVYYYNDDPARCPNCSPEALISICENLRPGL